MKDLAVKYTNKEGETKWKNIGFLMENEKGMFGMITAFGEVIKFSVFEHKKLEPKEVKAASSDLNDDIPW